ncbi:hypothetical protein TVAG_406390 [Trichomonas vaginalis G3]|uniref:Uncharacterized protein n=1 Tax=Trichomonas vaginalis (strain ATCC PRA-98 / G3) TaxID=412133 RepID=A2FNZ5_TRIV3|nr:hypothetical protein TVAG_406390 [Trichomonas vaginalis G3]|eukprot:XP_001306305.1 hypothetical protein [Trichomonas vaginalis G3]
MKGGTVGENITLWFRKSERDVFTPVYTFTYNGTDGIYYHNFKLPYVAAYYKHFWIITNDDEVNSDITYTYSNVKKELRISITTPIQPYYSPNTTVNLEGFAFNFDPGHLVQIKSRLNDGQIILTNQNEIIMDDNYKSNDFIFNITLPELCGNYLYRFYIYDLNTSKGGYTYEIYFKVSLPGAIYDVTNLEDTYSINAFIEVTFTGFQYVRGYLYFQYDNGTINKLDEIINFNGNNVTVTKQVPTKDYKLNIEEHNVTFFVYRVSKGVFSTNLNTANRNKQVTYI